MENNQTSPTAKSRFLVQLHVRQNMDVGVEANDEDEAWEVATALNRTQWTKHEVSERYDGVTQLSKPCSCGATMQWDDLHEAWDCENCHTCEAERSATERLRSASQKLYDSLQRYLMDVPDGELPEEMVEAMNDMEAAWRKADGTVPDPNDE